MTSLARHWSRWLWVLGVFQLLVAVCGSAWLVHLPYTTSSLRKVSPSAATAPPTAGSFSVGALRWNLVRLTSDLALAEHRSLFKEFCAGATGLQAAVCVSDVLVARTPAGVPSTEFLQRSYSPEGALRSILGGEPSHCVPLSGNLAAVLLSVGIPARVVQLVGPTLGHTLIEVWDGRWLLFDPMLGGVYVSGGQPIGATELEDSPRTDVVVMGGAPAGTFPSSNIVGDQAVLRQVSLVYPEPYLYTRVGSSDAAPVYRGAFSTVERSGTIVGRPQRAALFAVLGSSLAAVVLLVAGAFNRRTAQARGISGVRAGSNPLISSAFGLHESPSGGGSGS